MLEDLFRREWGRLVSALVRLFGPSRLDLAEDVVHDALVSAMSAWRLGPPADPTAWILQVARRHAIDIIRRDQRFADLKHGLASRSGIPTTVELALSPEADASNQLVMMFAICDDALSPETHVTLILRLLCGLSAAEIARAFLVDLQTIDRRLHRGRKRLQELGRLRPLEDVHEVRTRQPSVERALYLLFNEGFHGSDPEQPLQPAVCADALRLAELLLGASAVERRTVHALTALFCFDAARLGTRLDADGVMIPLAEQDRSRWSGLLVERGVRHLAASATGDHFTRWHLEAGIALEHVTAPSVAETNWSRVVELYDALLALAPSPIVALNRGLALAELRGPEAGRAALMRLADMPQLVSYSFFWAGLAELERRAGRHDAAVHLYERAASLARSRAERLAYERRLRELGSSGVSVRL